MSRNGIALGITGASGVVYGLRLLEHLLAQGEQVHLMVSKAAHMVIATETDFHLPPAPEAMKTALTTRFNVHPSLLHCYGPEQWTAPMASGSNAPRAMVICPCTSGTLSAIANGASNSLLERAADVMLKEQRKLILVLRETPLSAIHLENMLKLARMNATILPASPGFYQKPEHISQLVDFIVARILDHLHIANTLAPRWGDE